MTGPSLRSRFALLIAILVSLLSWLLGSLIAHDSSTRMRSEIGQDLAETAYQMLDRLDRGIATRSHIIQVLSRLQELQGDNPRPLLDHLHQAFPEFAWIGLSDLQGRVKAASGGLLEGASIAERPVFINGRERLFIGDVHDAVLLSKLLPNPSGETLKFLDISVPVFNARQEKTGVLAAHLAWEWAQDLRAAMMRPAQSRHTVEFFVLDTQQRIILGPRDLLGQQLHLPLLDKLSAEQPRWGVQTWPDGKDYLNGFALSSGYKDYPGLGWTVVARQSLEEAYAPAEELRRDILIWGIISALIVAFIGWLLASHFTRPLRQIARAADRLSAGQIIEIPQIDGTREIAQLSQSIRHLVESLSSQQTALGMMENLAHHDPLTGLPNRAALEKYLPRAQQRSQSKNSSLALLYLDLDGFKAINDRFGHAGGDQLLREVADRLRHALRDGDMVARLGGDEFLMVLQVTGHDSLNQARLIAGRVLTSLARPIELDGISAHIGCSIGGALWPQDDSELSDVLGLADQALYRAKHAGKGQAHFHLAT